MIRKRLLSFLKYMIFAAIGGGLVWWQITGMSPEEKTQFIASLKSIHYVYVFPIVIMGLLSHYFRALRWKMLADPIKVISRRNAFYTTMLGYFGNTFVPRAGEILRCSALAKYEKMPFPSVLGTVIVERAFDLVCFILFIVLTIVVQVDVVGQFVQEKTSNLFDGLTASAWLAAVLVLACLAAGCLLIRWIFRRFGENAMVQKIKGITAGLKEGLSTVVHLKNKGRFLALTFLIWLMYTAQIYLGFRTMEVTEHLGAGAAMSVLTLSTLAMIVSPGGLGAFPIAVQQVLLVYHVNNISFGWLVWGVNTAIILVAGGLSFLLLHLQNRSYENDKSDSGQNLRSPATYSESQHVETNL